MGGIDKGLAMLHGRPLIEHAIQALAPQVAHLLINANRNLVEYANYGYPVVRDELDDHQGPLAGFAALLDACEDPWLLAVPCDTPTLPTDLAIRLWNASTSRDADIAVAHDGQRLQPAHALIRTSLLPDLRTALDAGERSIHRWYACHNIVEVDFSDQPDCFHNLNRLADYGHFEKACQ